MFKKQPTLKQSTRLRSTDIRKLVEQIQTTYSIDPAIAKELVPKTLKNTPGVTHLDDPFTIYSSDTDPLFLSVRPEEKSQAPILIPTVYTLTRYSLLPTVLCAPAVIPKLATGADLMAPGLVEDQSLSHLPRGALVAIESASEPGVPKGVGKLAEPMKDILANPKGKAVFTIHAVDDALWNMGAKKLLPKITLASTEEEDATTAKEKENEAANDKQEQTEEQNDNGDTVQEDSIPKPTLSPQEVTKILRTALLLAIKRELSKSTDPFPLFASTLYSQYVLPYRPLDIAEDVDMSSIDIKKSSYKKLSPWLKSLAKEKIITIKEQKNGDVNILSVNGKNDDVKALKDYVTVGDAAKKDKENEQKQAERQKASEAKLSKINITNLAKPMGSSVGFFEALQLNTEELYLPTDVRKHLNTYVSKHELVHPREQNYIILDNLLKSCLLSQKERNEQDEAMPFLSRADAGTRLRDNMQEWHSFRIGQGEPSLRKGPCPNIEVSLKTVRGKNRSESIVSGLEKFEISAEKFAEELQVVCASSATTNKVTSKSSNNPKFNAIVKGDHRKQIVDLLVEKGVPKNVIK